MSGFDRILDSYPEEDQRTRYEKTSSRHKGCGGQIVLVPVAREAGTRYAFCQKCNLSPPKEEIE